MVTAGVRVALPAAVLALVATVGCGASPPAAPPPMPEGTPTVASTDTLSSPTRSSVVESPTTAPAPSDTPAMTRTPTRSASPSVTPTAPPPQDPAPRSCSALVSRLSLAQRVGQLFMVGVDSHGLTSRDAQVLSDGDVGSVIFLQNSTAGASAVKRLVARVRRTTTSPQGIDTMITVDQEGGRVQRLRGPGFDRIPSARQQARRSDRELTADARAWGRQLKGVGVDADLAPVADVVPTRFEAINEPIGQLDRGYGPEVGTVADKVSAFVHGMDQAKIATSVKHFPGLGQVRGNTDFTAHVVDSATTRHDADLRGFAAGAKSGVDMMMVSTAFYARIDPKRRAAFSPIIIKRMIRGDLGFTGVVISDDLAARAVRDLVPGARALAFLRAGGDLTIVGDPRVGPAMVEAVVAEAKKDPAFAADVRTKATRVVTMKGRRGLADCG